MIGSLYTTNCIITGKVATCWSGHIVMDELNILTLGKFENVHVIAGFADLETMKKVVVNEIEDKYLGLYKPEYGIILRLALTQTVK